MFVKESVKVSETASENEMVYRKSSKLASVTSSARKFWFESVYVRMKCLK